MNFLKVKQRVYLKLRPRVERAHELDGKLCHASRADAWLEAEIELCARRDSASRKVGADDAIELARDAFYARDFERVQTILWEQADAPLDLSVTGAYGDVVSPRAARRQSFESNLSMFEDGSFPITDANRQWGTNFHSATACARYVRDCDGGYAGLDVHDTVSVGRGERVLITSCCGCVHDEIERAIPSLAPLIPYHLTTTKSGTPEQMRALDEETKRRSAETGRTWGVWGEKTYTKQAEYLKSIGIYEADEDGEVFAHGVGVVPARGCAYGMNHYAHALPTSVLETVWTLWNAEQERKCVA